jgi:hypothetical protein
MACGGRLERSVGRASSPASASAGQSGSTAVPSGGVASVGGGVPSGDGGVPSGDGGVPSGDGGQGGDAGGSGLDPCTAQFIDYGDYRSQVMVEFSTFGCKVDSDCLSFYDQSACDTSCVLLTTGARRGVIDRLNNFETTYCSQECSPQPWMMCPTPFTAHCVSGRCQ